mmetsp:Transcript_25395/g.37657  ORF Transcript_25395/g.37657 Transcript_25395/m.37657 type:complete len:130 (+) Transcript_25395:122-511(+)
MNNRKRLSRGGRSGRNNNTATATAAAAIVFLLSGGTQLLCCTLATATIVTSNLPDGTDGDNDASNIIMEAMTTTTRKNIMAEVSDAAAATDTDTDTDSTLNVFQLIKAKGNTCVQSVSNIGCVVQDRSV